MAAEKPFEATIELTRECNYSCPFCFGKNFSPRPTAPAVAGVKKVLENAASSGIGRVRFTGGEPLLRKDLAGILSFAKEQGLFVSLNTNGSLLSAKNVSSLSPFLDDILVSFHAFNERGEHALGGKPAAFERKVKAIKALDAQGVFVRAATILSPANIAALEKFHTALSSLPVSHWVLLRQIPSPANLHPLSHVQMGEAVEKVLHFRKAGKGKMQALVENAFPFCCCSPPKASKSALGGLREDGHSTLFIDSALQIKPSYFLDLSLGSALKTPLLEAWNASFMKRMRALEFIAEECHACRFVKKCMSGSRFSALLCNGSLYALDPLARPHLYREQLFM